MKILIVDDERAVRDSLSRALRLNGYEVALAEHGMQALQAMHEDRPDAVVLDVNMPGADGFAVARRLRADGDDVPILMLTARDDVADRVQGLDVGADDYLVKPFALEELLARLRALLRRAAPEPSAAPAQLRAADLTLDLATLTVHRGDRELELTRTELELLRLFMENPNRVLTRDIIHEQVWGYDASTSSNTLEVYIGYLRRKLEADGEPRLIQTVRGFGYALREPGS